MNKKAETEAGEFLMLIAYMMVMVAIGFGIWAGTSFFFSAEYDFRTVDAELLNNKISACIQNNNINWDQSDKNTLTQEFLTKCQLNQKILNSSLFILVKSNDLQLIRLGKGDEVQCNLSDKNNLYLRCFNSTLQNENRKYFIQTGSNQKSEQRLTGGTTAPSYGTGGEFGGGGGGGSFQ